MKLPSLTPGAVSALAGHYRAGRGVGEAARMARLRFTDVAQWYEYWREHPAIINTTALTQGDPPASRSALANHRPWVPQYDDQPVVAASREPTQPPEEQEPAPEPQEPLLPRVGLTDIAVQIAQEPSVHSAPRTRNSFAGRPSYRPTAEQLRTAQRQLVAPCAEILKSLPRYGNQELPKVEALARVHALASLTCGEDPLQVIAGKTPTRVKTRAKHYVIAALHRVYPTARISNLGRLAGANDPVVYAHNSLMFVSGLRGDEKARRARWFEAELLVRLMHICQHGWEEDERSTNDGERGVGEGLAPDAAPEVEALPPGGAPPAAAAGSAAPAPELERTTTPGPRADVGTAERDDGAGLAAGGDGLAVEELLRRLVKLARIAVGAEAAVNRGNPGRLRLVVNRDEWAALRSYCLEKYGRWHGRIQNVPLIVESEPPDLWVEFRDEASLPEVPG